MGKGREVDGDSPWAIRVKRSCVPKCASYGPSAYCRHGTRGTLRVVRLATADPRRQRHRNESPRVAADTDLRAECCRPSAVGDCRREIRPGGPDVQTGFALARDVAKGPTLVHALVGAAIATLMTDRVREMIQQLDCPNLYWALSTLPRPLVDFRPGFDAETLHAVSRNPGSAGLGQEAVYRPKSGASCC